TVRGVARALGGRYLDTGSEHAGHTIELAPTVHLWARQDWRKRDAIHWGARCPLVSLSNVPSVRTALARPVAAIAADLRRRLVPAAQTACRSALSAAGKAKDQEQARQLRLAELEAILGPIRSGHDQWHYADGFRISHDELLGRSWSGEISAEVRVHSWHCLLMIARLVAEDARVANAAKPPERE
ncbi:MAG TPA: hypothetical protein VGE76_07365, partial [Opitutaceae bacterium]